jgi:hypothetical protein
MLSLHVLGCIKNIYVFTITCACTREIIYTVLYTILALDWNAHPFFTRSYNAAIVSLANANASLLDIASLRQPAIGVSPNTDSPFEIPTGKFKRVVSPSLITKIYTQKGRKARISEVYFARKCRRTSHRCFLYPRPKPTIMHPIH